jgi:transposase
MSKSTKSSIKAATQIATAAQAIAAAPTSKEPFKESSAKQLVLLVIKDIQRQTRKQYSAEEKIRIVPDGLRGESSVVMICRREGCNTNIYYRWSKKFTLSGKGLLEPSRYTGCTPGTLESVARKEKERVAELALERLDLSCLELAWHITYTEGWFISESTF